MTDKVITKICAICEDRWQPSVWGDIDNSDPYKICLNCRFIGPDAPGKYNIPKGKPKPFYVYDREYIIVSEDEMRRLYQEYFAQLADMTKRKKQK